MADGQWASISRDTMQKVVEHLHAMGVLDGVQWAYLRRVCHGWNQRIISLLDILPDQLKESGNYRIAHLPAARYLEQFLLRNYPHRIHALSSVNADSHQTLGILAQILHTGCHINVFQFRMKYRTVESTLRYLGIIPDRPVILNAFVEDYTGDLFVYVGWWNFPLNTADLRRMERVLVTPNDGQSVFTWHSYCFAKSETNNPTPGVKRHLELRHVGQRGWMLIFRNRDADVNMGRPFDYNTRGVYVTLRSQVAKKRHRPPRNAAEMRLVRMHIERYGEESE